MTQHHKRCPYGPTFCWKSSSDRKWTHEQFLGPSATYRLTTPTRLSQAPQWAPSWPGAPLTLPSGTFWRVKTGGWHYDRRSSTHYWEGLQSQGRWSWPCCCKFLAISPALSLDLLLTTGFSCHKSEYHVLKKKEETKCYIILEKSIYSLISKRCIILTNSLVLRIQIYYRAHKKGTSYGVLSSNTQHLFSHVNHPARGNKNSPDQPLPCAKKQIMA